MENKIAHIVNTTINYKFNKDVILLRCSNRSEYCSIQVRKIFGTEVSWVLPEFRAADIYEYFEKQIVDDICDKVFNKRIVEIYKGQYELTQWLSEEMHHELRVDIMPLAAEIMIGWNMMRDQIINTLGQLGYLSPGLYDEIVSGYFKTVVGELFTIDIDGVNYSKEKKLIGWIEVLFYNGSKLSISIDLFNSQSIYNELTRFISTDKLIKNIKTEVRELMCRQILT